MHLCMGYGRIMKMLHVSAQESELIKFNKTQAFPISNHRTWFHFTDILVSGLLLTV